MIEELMPVRSRKIMESAKGEVCQLRLSGICNSDTSTTVFAHAPSQFKAMSLKGNDFWGMYACSNCHDVIDGRVASTCTNKYLELSCYSAIEMTIFKLIKKGIITIK